MKKILILLFLFAPYLANAQMWFKANGFYVATEDITGKWQKCNIPVCLGEDQKLTIYNQEINTIRALSETENCVEESGVSSIHWLAVDKNGRRCFVDIQSDRKSFIHLVILFLDDDYAICYNLISDD